MPDRTPPSTTAPGWPAGRFLRLGVVTAAVLVLCLGGWSAFAAISGAVVTEGRLKVLGERQVVQHLTGGIVAALEVREGDRVGAGQVLLRLDGRRLQAELAIVGNQLQETQARIARLEAEQDGAEAPRFPDDLRAAAAADPEVAAILHGQERLFTSRLERLHREREQLRERQLQIGDEIEGLDAERRALARQLDLLEQELRDQRSLLDRGLTQATRVLSLEREVARIEGEIGALTAATAQARGRITELDLQRSAVEGNRVEEAATQLSDLKATAADLRERRLELQETIGRLKVRAPRDGVVLGLSVFTVGAVVQPGEPVLWIVPTGDALVADVRIRPQDIDQVWPGQPARLHLAAANQRITPEIPSRVLRVSADALEDPATGQHYFTAELEVTDDARAQLGDIPVVAGMPVNAFIETGVRSPISYLMRPMTDFLSRSWRER